MSLASRLLEWRSKEGLSQGGAALRIGCSQSCVSDWESGKSEPRVEHARLVAAAMGISLDELVKGSPARIRATRAPKPAPSPAIPQPRRRAGGA